MILAIFGVMALVSAASMLVLREPMRVALALIASMTSLGAVYGLIGVHFIAAFQVLIYVGAVMVFMVYVIMLLEVREATGRSRFSRLALPGVIAAALLCGVLGISVMRGQPSTATSGAGQAIGESFTLVAFSKAFLSTYWLEFELTTVLLVGAIVSALAVISVSRRDGGRHG